MRVYFSGIGGVGIGPLAEIAHDAGYHALGSDLAESLVTQELRARGIQVTIGQDGSFLRDSHGQEPIDWFVYTAALPEDHPELVTARELGIKTAKRDELIAHIVREKDLQLIAIAGTHGKTTTTGMMVWALQKLGIPVSYSIGSTVSFGPSGAFHPDSKYFIYECDEYDKNFLHFHPYLSLITSIDYDHPDTYPTQQLYAEAFYTFMSQSLGVIMWQSDMRDAGRLKSIAAQLQLIDGDSPAVQQRLKNITLAGVHNRRNAYLVVAALHHLLGKTEDDLFRALNTFPGTDRRFEKLDEHLYSDYGHHPVEIAATLQLARELSDHVVLVYQPHQNRRQHALKDEYTDQFTLAEKIYWVPTYLSREDAAQAVLSPEQLTQNLTNKHDVVYSELDDSLWEALQEAKDAGKLVLLMGAGTIDGWAREKLAR